MKFGVLIFFGTGCVEDLIYVFKQVVGRKEPGLFHKHHDVFTLDFTVNF